MATIGFIGLGNMGLPMAQNLLKAGHAVAGFDVTHGAAAALAAGGAGGDQHPRRSRGADDRDHHAARGAPCPRGLHRRKAASSRPPAPARC